MTMKICFILFLISFLSVEICCQDINITTHGTVQNHSPFSPREDAKALWKAMKRLGTDNSAIINILGYRSNKQRQKIIVAYKQAYGKDLIKDLKNELSGNFESLVEALMMTPRNYDVYSLDKAMSGIGTDEDALIEILASRSNAEIKVIKDLYKNEKGEDLEEELLDETSGDFSTLLITLANATRNETTTVDAASARADAEALYQAGEMMWWGTDESTFNMILCSRSFPQLRTIFIEYNEIANRDILMSIEREFSGYIELGFKAVVEIARNEPVYFASRLHQAMDGYGTDEDTLTRITTSRSEIDMVEIKQEFQRMYEKSLSQVVQEDTSGNYEALLLAIIG